MKIAFLSFYNGQIDRGVEVAVSALAKGLGKNHDVTVFQTGEKIQSEIKTVKLGQIDYWPEDTSNSLLRFIYLDYYSRKIFSFATQFIKYFSQERYDVVIPTNGGWQVLICRILTWIGGKKLIVAGNSGIGRDDFWQLLCFPDLFIAISPVGLSWAKKKAPWVKSIYIPYGVNVDEIQKSRPAKIPHKKPIVLCVSAFLPYKRIEKLILAMQDVQASLLLIGMGPLHNKLQKMGKDLLGERFLLLTNITHDKLLSYYKACDVFSLPSKSSEAFGIVYIEAMAANLLVVAPDDLNRREIIGNSGIFVDPENIDNYSKALNQALNTDFGDKPRKQAEKFSWDKIVKQYELFLKNI